MTTKSEDEYIWPTFLAIGIYITGFVIFGFFSSLDSFLCVLCVYVIKQGEYPGKKPSFTFQLFINDSDSPVIKSIILRILQC